MVMETKYQSHNVHHSSIITISQAELRNILQCIETDFIESKTYLQSLTDLENSLGKSVTNLSLILGSLGREAIKLTFRELAKYCNIVALTTEGKKEKLVIQNPIPNHDNSSEAENMSPSSQTASPVSTAPNPHLVVEEKNNDFQSTQSTQSINLNHSQSQSNDLQSNNLKSTTLPSTELVVTPSQLMKTKKLTKLELANQLAAQEREKGLEEIRTIFYQARIQRGWSIDYLHDLTFIPRHQITALESGDLKTLPEDIYLRGFIRRLAEALHLDVSSLLQKLPQLDATKTVLPSWYHDPQPSTSEITPIHLYLGYSTLLAGALGGLAMITSQETGHVLPELPTLYPTSNSSTSESNFPTNKSGINNQIREAHRSIAPPESTF